MSYETYKLPAVWSLPDNSGHKPAVAATIDQASTPEIEFVQWWDS